MTEPVPFTVLFVCLGNVCRSPLAERLLRLRLEEHGVASSYAVSSAGLIGLVGRPMEPHAAAELVSLGGDPSGFEGRRLTTGMVDSADLVLTATVEIRGAVLQEAPSALRRTFTIREFAALVDGGPDCESAADLVADAARRRSSTAGLDLDVRDPMGRSVTVHAAVARAIAEAVEVIASVLTQVADVANQR